MTFLPQPITTNGRRLLTALTQGARRKIATPEKPASYAHKLEDEDAEITGMTRSLHRRAMALNFPVTGLSRP